MTLHRFPNRQPAPSRQAGATCSGDPPSPGQGLEASATMAALERIAEPPTQADWHAHIIATQEPPMPHDLPDYADPDMPDFADLRDGGNLDLSWWQRQAPVDRALLTMLAAVCVATLAVVAWQVWP